MRNIAVVFCIAFIVFGFGSCKKNPVEPPYPDDSNATPGRRDYTWVKDTINNPFLHFTNIWGNSIYNIWTTGALMSDGLYKYNGQSWNLDNRVYISCPDGVWGFGDNVWISNDKGSIWKFSGNSYTQQLKDFSIDGSLVNLANISGSSNNEIYAAGAVRVNNVAYPIILKYNGYSWTLAMKLSELGGFNNIKYCSKNDKYYLILGRKDYSIELYEYDRNNLKLLYIYKENSGTLNISTIDGYAYFIVNKKVYRYFNDRWELIFEYNDPNFGCEVWGRNRNDIIIRMQDGIAHFNGTDIKYLIKSESPIMLAPNSVIFDNDIFVPGQLLSSGINIIYHGKLN